MDGKHKRCNYLEDVAEAATYIDSRFVPAALWKDHFLPGKEYTAALKKANAKIIMWDVLSGDFDNRC